MINTTIEAILVGRARPFGPNGEPSAIEKRAVSGAVSVGPEGAEGMELQLLSRPHPEWSGRLYGPFLGT